MRRIILALAVLFIVASSFHMPSCYKSHPTSSNIQVDITFDDGTEKATFTGEQGQGTFVFDSNNTSHLMPNTGTYGICIEFGGGCGGYRLSEENGPNLLLVMPAGGTTCGSGFTLVSKYNGWQNCE